MGSHDNTGRTQFRSSIARLMAASRRHVVGLGFSAAVVVISLATAYATFGAGSDKQLRTESSQSKTAEQQKDASSDAEVQQEGNSMSNSTGDAAGQQSTGRQGGTSNKSHSTTDITVNGQRVDVPDNGNIEQTITTDGGQTNISVQSSHSSTTSGSGSSNSSNSSVQMNVTSRSDSTSQ